MESKIKELNKIIPLLRAKGYEVQMTNYNNYRTITVSNVMSKVIQESNIDSILNELKQLV